VNFFMDRLKDEHSQQRSLFRRHGFYRFLLVFLIFGLFGVVVWISYEEGVKSGTEAIIPIVRAEKELIKVRPEKPGGMSVPFQDKLVYGQLAEKDTKQPEATQLLPPPEEAVAPPKAAEVSLKTKAPQQQASEAPAADTQTKSEEEPIFVKSITPVEKSVRIQIASMRSETQAQAQWLLAQKTEHDLLGALTLHVQRVNLGEIGVFFRVQAGPLGGIEAAKDLCSKLQQRKLGCLVVRP